VILNLEKTLNIIIKRLGIILCVGSFLSFLGIASARAQDSAWSEPYRLSSDAGKASEASLVADQYGFVHCFWIETLYENQRSIIQYARFDGATWSDRNDIFVGRGDIEDMSVAIDQDGILHIVWSEGLTGPVYYSRAPANDAQSTRSWIEPIRLDIPAGILRLQIDTKGIFHLLYINRGNEVGVYYVRSEDHGMTWSEPVWLDPDIPFDHSPANLNFELDDRDGLHAVWNYLALDRDVPNINTIRYIHSLDDGASWSLPFTIDQNVEGIDYDLQFADPRMIVQGQTVHIIWAAGSLPYRHHRFSTDAGQTWSVSTQIFGELHGQAGDGLTVDSDGRVHFFGQIRYPLGIYHAYWDRNQWTSPSLVYFIAQGDFLEGIGDRIHAHATIPIVRAGNQLVLTFTDGPADPNRRLFAMVSTLDDVLPIDLVPTPVPSSTPVPEPSPTTMLPSAMPTLTATRTFFDTTKPVSQTPRPDSAIWVALLPNLLLFGVIVSWSFYKIKIQKPHNKGRSKNEDFQ
jgi:hypothetical protein